MSTTPIPLTLDQQIHYLYGQNPGLHFVPYWLGFVIDAILLGVLISQYTSWLQYSARTDGKYIRWLVGYLALHSFAYTAFLVSWIWSSFVAGFGNWAGFTSLEYAAWTMLLDSLARTPASLFFGHRAWLLSGKSNLLIIVLTPLFLVSIGGAFWAKFYGHNLFITKESLIGLFMWSGGEVASNIIITAVITIQLFRSSGDREGTNKLVKRFVVKVAETQLPPTILLSGYLITLIIDPLNPYGPFFMPLPKFYIMAVMIVLNDRVSLRRDLETTNKYRSKGGVEDGYGMTSRNPRNRTEVFITTETIRQVDGPVETDDFDKDTEIASTSGEPAYTSKTRLTSEGAVHFV